VSRSRNHCCREKAAIFSLFIVVGVDVAVHSIKVFIIAMELQEWVRFALLSRYRIFHTAVNKQ
jgi:hypothetical protein